MVTERTPMHKRVRRAEASSIAWKVKATARREENERLKDRIDELEQKVTKLKKILTKTADGTKASEKEMQANSEALETANAIVEKQEKEIAELKKKRVR